VGAAGARPATLYYLDGKQKEAATSYRIGSGGGKKAKVQLKNRPIDKANEKKVRVGFGGHGSGHR
jgi:hypothetical protein